MFEACTLAGRHVDRAHHDAIGERTKILPDVAILLIDHRPVSEAEICGLRVLEPVVMDHVTRHLRLERGRGFGDRGNRVGRAARADRTRAERRRAGIAVAHNNVVRVNAKRLRGDLRHGGFVALALRRIALIDRDLATRVDAHGDNAIARLVLERHEHVRGDAGELGAAGEADPEIAPCGARVVLHCAKASEIDHVDERIPRFHVIAAVVIDAGNAREREGGNQVLALERGRLEAELARQHVEPPLERETCRQRTEGARRTEAGLVGDRTAQLDVSMVDRIGVRQHHRAERGHDEAPIDALASVANIGDAAISKPEDASVPVGRNLEVVDLIAPLAHGHEMLLARLDPANGAAQLAREMADHDVLAVERRLDAEAAALIARRDDSNLGGRELEEVGERETLDMRALRRQMERQPVCIAPDRERASGLDRTNAATLGAKTLFEDYFGLGEQRLDRGVVLGDFFGFESARVTGAEDLVIVPVVVDPRRSGVERRFGVGHDGQRVIVDLHGVRGVLGDIFVLGEDGGERLAVPVHLVHGQGPVLPVFCLKGRDQHRDLLSLHLFRELGAGDRTDHAWHLERGIEPDGRDLGVRMARANEAKMQAIGHADIGEIFAPTGEQTGILAAFERTADPACLAGHAHGVVSVPAGGGAGLSPWRRAEAARIASTMWL